MKIFTANVMLHTNLSYAIMARRLISALTTVERERLGKKEQEPVEWIYGEYGSNNTLEYKKDNLTLVPFPFDQNGNPTLLGEIWKNHQPELIMMHDDGQRVGWMAQQPFAPVLYWIPLDHENPIIRHEVLSGADRIVSVSKFGQKKIQEAGYDCEQVYDPIDTSVYYPDPLAGKKLRDMMGIPDDDYIITFIGRPNWRKRPAHIIKVAAKVIKKNPKVHFLLHSDLRDPSWGNPQGMNVRELLYMEGLSDSPKAVLTPADLRFDVGHPENVMQSIFNATDVYFSPHGGEGMGLPIAEAMSAGKPFVCTDYTTTQEFAGYKDKLDMYGPRGVGAKIGRIDGKEFIVDDMGVPRPYCDLDDMADKILYLLENKDLRDKMGIAGRKYAVKNIDKSVVASKIGKIMVEMIDFAGVLSSETLRKGQGTNGNPS